MRLIVPLISQTSDMLMFSEIKTNTHGFHPSGPSGFPLHVEATGICSHSDTKASGQSSSSTAGSANPFFMDLVLRTETLRG